MKGKNILKIITCLTFISFICLISSNIYAGFFEDAISWFKGGKIDDTMENSIGQVTKDIEKYVEILGTAVIVIATIVLGLRYMLAGAEGKSLAKENMMNLLVACILFFGWTSISGLLFNGDSGKYDFLLWRNANSVESAVKNVYALVVYILQIIAFIIVLYFGIKYIFAGAEGKAELKSKSLPFIVGIILSFSAVQVLKIISNIINETV